MTNLEYRNKVYAIMGKPPIRQEEKKEKTDIRKFKKSKQKEEYYRKMYQKLLKEQAPGDNK